MGAWPPRPSARSSSGPSGDLLANPPHTLTAHCPACQHGELLDLRAFVCRYGGDILPIELKPLLRCERCGHKGADIIIGGGGLRSR